MYPSARQPTIQASKSTTEHRQTLLSHTKHMEEESAVAFHLASSSDLEHVNIPMDDMSVEHTEEDQENISTPSEKKDKRKSKRDDDVDYVAIAKGLSSKEKKLKFSRLISQSAPEKHILCIGVLFTFFGSLTALATPVLMGSMFDAVSSGNDTAPDIEGRPTEVFCAMSPIGCDDEEGLLKTAVSTLFCLALLAAIFAFGKWFSLEVTGIYLYIPPRISHLHILAQQMQTKEKEWLLD